MKVLLLPRGRAAFTLTELLVVITIIGLLFAMVLVVFSLAERSSKRKVSKLRLDTMRSALDTYKDDIGEYPEPANPGDTIDIAGKTYEVSGAAMLYQVLSGDGTDQILIRGGSQEKSDGDPSPNERKNVKLKPIPKDMWTMKSEIYFMVDGFGRPFQYVRAVAVDPNATGTPTQATINQSSFDIWSYAEDVENTTARSIDTLGDDGLKQDALKWVRNW